MFCPQVYLVGFMLVTEWLIVIVFFVRVTTFLVGDTVSLHLYLSVIYSPKIRKLNIALIIYIDFAMILLT